MMENIDDILHQQCGLLADRPVIVGVSGGPDSLCLLDVMHRAGYLLVVAILNHGMRPEAVDEVEMVQRIASQMGLACITGSVDTYEYSAEHALSLEAAARQLRYDFLFSEARNVSAQAVAIGHTADDQAETILLHLLRGTGLTGLKGMEFRSWLPRWSEDIPLVRPLLTTWRNEVFEYCHQNQLTPAQDATNENLDFLRNRLRHEVLPYLEQFQPHFRQHLVRMAGNLALDYELVQKQVDAAWDSCVEQQGSGNVAINIATFRHQPVVIRRYLIRKAMLTCRTGLQDVEMAMIDRGVACLSRPPGRRTCDLGAGLRLVVEQNLGWITTRDAGLPDYDFPATQANKVIELPVPGRIALQNGWVVSVEVQEVGWEQQKPGSVTQDLYQACFDADQLALPLSVRTRLPGDSFHPLGMVGKTVKISDLMINLKLPYRSRAQWPLICAGGEIIWVPGCRVSDAARPGGTTRRCLNIKLFR